MFKLITCCHSSWKIHSSLLLFRYQDVPYIHLMCAKFEGNPITCLRFMVFLQLREKKKSMNKWANFWRQEWLAQFTSDLVCDLPWHARICTVNLVFLRQQITGLQTNIKIYCALLFVSIYSHSVQPHFIWAAQHTTMCLDMIFQVL